MPAEPTREKTMAAMADRMSTIAAGDLYWTTPSLVTRALLAIDQYDEPVSPLLSQGPVLGVVRASGSMFGRRAHRAPAPGGTSIAAAFDHEQRVTVWGYVRGDDDGVIAATLLERLWQDTVECLLADPTLGGVARMIEPEGPLDTDDGALEPLGYFAQDWLIRPR